MKTTSYSPSSRHIMWAAVAIILMVLAAYTARDPIPFSSDDYGQYLLHAAAIAEGRPYWDTGYLYSHFAPFVGPPATAPGFPLTLVPLVALGHPSPALLKVAIFVVLGAFLWIVGRYWATFDPVLAAGSVLLTGTALLLARAPAQVGTDILFCAFVWTCLFLTDRPGPWGPYRILGVAVCGGMALLYRIAGAPLIPALAIVWLLRRNQIGWRPLGIVVFWGLLFGLSSVVLQLGIVPPAPAAVVREWLILDGQQGQQESTVDIVVRNIWRYREGVFAGLLYPFPWNRVNDIYHLVAVPIGLVGFARWGMTSFRSMAFIFAVFYAGMLILVGVVDARYLWPLYPVISFAFLSGLQSILRFIVAQPSRVAVGVGAAIALAAVFHDPYHDHAPVAVTIPEVHALDDALRIIAADQPTMRVAFIKPRSLTWRTGIPAMPLFRARPSVTLRELQAQEISHVVTGDLGLAPDLTASWDSLARTNPDQFRPVYESTEFRVYEFR